ncbi:hypothetical protein H4R18_000082 [Coemansia javaensis]|uniref:Uncharacterized protein n=1 Tax=Coemansia javaensis TaxID=2761396 RepID=A0A9W8LL59_9FUNG|nr:hypothetical protein H4R18_000082 [Coemansia javaensis]
MEAPVYACQAPLQGARSRTSSPRMHPYPHTHSHMHPLRPDAPRRRRSRGQSASHGALLPVSAPTAAEAPGAAAAPAKRPANGKAASPGDDWSPFEAPAVRQCLSSPPELLPSLLGRREATPLYTPPRRTGLCTARPATRNPALVTTTYAGCMRPGEQIALHIRDLESGEFLRRLPL